MMENNIINSQNKIATVNYIDIILQKLYNWMPFKRKNGGIIQDSIDENGNQTLQTTNQGEIALGKYNETDIKTLLSIGIGSESERKNAITISNNGEIFVITDIKRYKVESLQKKLNKQTPEFIDNYSDINEYLIPDNKGKFIYVSNGDDIHKSGLYILGINLNNEVKPYLIGNSSQVDLSKYYTKAEIHELIDAITAGDIDLTNYYTISETDKLIKPLNESVSNLENWVNTPLTTNEVNQITI